MRNLDWRTKAFLAGGAVGALLGLGAAYIYVNSVEKEGAPPKIQPAEAVGIGLALLAVLRQIASLHEGDAKKRKQVR
jgi:hypothetical protein